MRRIAAWVCALAIGGTAMAAAAQPAPKKGEDERKELDFEGDVIETNFLKPEGSIIEGERRRGGSSLLKIRTDFIAEIVRSADDL